MTQEARITRRGLLAAGIAGSGALAAACGGSQAEPSGQAVNAPAARVTLAAAVPQVRLFRLTAYPPVNDAITQAFNARVLTGQAEPGTVLKELKPVLQGIVNT